MIKNIKRAFFALAAFLFTFNLQAACFVNYDKAGNIASFPKGIEVSKESTKVKIISDSKSESLDTLFFAQFETTVSLKNKAKDTKSLNLGALVSYVPQYEGVQANTKLVQSNLNMSIVVNGKKIPFTANTKKITGDQNSLDLHSYNFPLKEMKSADLKTVKVAYKIPLIADGRVMYRDRSLVIFSFMDMQPNRKTSFSVDNGALKNDEQTRGKIANKMLSYMVSSSGKKSVLKDTKGLFWNYDLSKAKYNEDFSIYMPTYVLELIPYTEDMLKSYLSENDSFHQVPRGSVEEIKADLLRVYKNIANNGLNKGKFNFAFKLLTPAKSGDAKS